LRSAWLRRVNQPTGAPLPPLAERAEKASQVLRPLGRLGFAFGGLGSLLERRSLVWMKVLQA